MDPSSFFRFASSVSAGISPGQELGGGFFAGYISHTANSVPTHALIVAPAATGASGTEYTLTTNYRLRTTSTATPTSTSVFDGRANTDAMIAVGISQFPAAQFCTSLSIGGFTDWYLPAIYEMEIAYYNLKPTTNENVIGVTNQYSVPSRMIGYTPTDPAQTGASIFRVGNAEAFASSLDFHWTSTFDAGDGVGATVITFRDGFFIDDRDPAANLYKVRAFRKIAV